MAQKFKVKIAVEISPEGEEAEFADYQLNYHNMSYESLQELQRALAETLLGLGDSRLPAAAQKKRG